MEVSSTTVFQFLIGRLVTKRGGKRRREYIEFQFLIGRLVTIADERAIVAERLFQFLIGRLVTYPYRAIFTNKYCFNSS